MAKGQMFKRSLLLAALAWSCACARQAPPQALGVYHWKTRVDWQASDESRMDALGVDRLYVRCFDLDWDAIQKRPVLLGGLQGSLAATRRKVVPVVYLTQDLLKHLAQVDGPRLSKKILATVEERLQSVGIQSWSELQVDADWAPGTRLAYFALLQRLKAGLPRQALSATIRLHQVKYATLSGIPPVDRGVLMAYHSSSPTDYTGKNSILDVKTAAAYLKTVGTYPLALELALPNFTWGVLFGPDRAAKRILSGLSHADADASELTRKRRFSWGWDITRSGQLGGYPVSKGDRLRVDETGPAEALALARTIDQRVFARWILFDDDPTRLKAFEGSLAPASGWDHAH